MSNLNEAIIRKDVAKSINEAVYGEGQKNKRPKGVKDWTFADWFGEDLSGMTYDGDIHIIFDEVTSLKGAPKIVNGDFRCNSNTITSLEGAPKEVHGNFTCIGSSITSLEGAPKIVDGDFNCSDNSQLTSLEGAPKELPHGNFRCDGCESLTSLEGMPKVMNGNVFFYGSPLASLEGIQITKNNFFSFDDKTIERLAKEIVAKNIALYSYGIKNDHKALLNKGLTGKDEFTFADWFGEDLTGQTYKEDIWCDNAGLTSLRGAPKIVVGDFHCSGNKLASLEGGPEKVAGLCRYDNNNLTSLEGAPKEVGSFFSCEGNKLTSLEGLGEVGGEIHCARNKISGIKLLATRDPEGAQARRDSRKNATIEKYETLIGQHLQTLKRQGLSKNQIKEKLMKMMEEMEE